jgi:hypothetical protein
MKRLLVGSAMLLAAVVPAFAQSGTGCQNADPNGVLANVGGDFELATDPTDPNHIMFVSNVTPDSTAPQNVVVAQIDGQTGRVVAGSLTVIANNFSGLSRQNGPEWMQAPDGRVGVVYAGAGGVHGVYRAASPSSWNAFQFNWNNTASSGSPSLLPDTFSSAFPGSPLGPPTKAATIPQAWGKCTTTCYGAYNTGKTTDIGAVIAAQGYVYSNSTMPDGSSTSSDGLVYIAACQGSACGIYEAKIDGNGGLTFLQQVASTGSWAVTRMAVGRHPTTGTFVMFTDAPGNVVNVWQQQPASAPPYPQFTLIGSVPVPAGYDHFRTLASNAKLILNFFVRQGAPLGTYSITINARGGSLVVPSSPMLLSSATSGGSELKFLPLAAKWLLMYRTTRTPANAFTRCWVTP